MESLNVFILLLLLISAALNVFVIFILLRANLKRNEEQINLHKHISQIGESLNIYVENQTLNAQRLDNSIKVLTEEVNQKLEQQKSIIEDNAKRSNVVLSNIKDRVEYLSTEVTIN